MEKGTVILDLTVYENLVEENKRLKALEGELRDKYRKEMERLERETIQRRLDFYPSLMKEIVKQNKEIIEWRNKYYDKLGELNKIRLDVDEHNQLMVSYSDIKDKYKALLKLVEEHNKAGFFKRTKRIIIIDFFIPGV